MAKTSKTKKIATEDPRLSYLNAQISAAQKEFNSDNIYAASDHGKTLFGIPLPSLALEYLFTSNVLLMSKLIGLAGQKGSLKSSFGFEMLRWFIEWRGMGVLIETENKASEQYISIIQDLAKYCQFSGVKSTQEAQSHITFYHENHTKDESMNKIPLCMVLDSLSGSEGDVTKAAITSEGHATKGYSENALLYTPYLKTMSSNLIAKPEVLVYTNHLKEKVGGATRPGMPAAKTTPGGTGQGFHAAYYLYMALVGALKSITRPGKEVSLFTEKNSMGPDKRKIVAEFLWWYREDDPHTQLSYWDWYATTSKFLVSPDSPKAATNIVQLKCKANRYSSSVLEFKDLTATEAGFFIENCPVFRAKIQGALNIPLRYIWDDGKIVEASKCETRLNVNLPPGSIKDELVDKLNAFNERIYKGEVDVATTTTTPVEEESDEVSTDE